MITPVKENMLRVTLTLDPVDVDLLDRLAALEGANRSQELRGVMLQLRPMLSATVVALEGAQRQREAFDRAAAEVAVTELEAVMPELEKAQRAYLGAMAKLEGRAAAADPRPGNTGVTPPTPPASPDDENPEA